jgi:hypothetical protein
VLLLSLPLWHLLYIFPAQPTAAQINEAVRQNQEAVKLFNSYLDTDRALVQLIIAATPDTYIKALCDPMFGYANVTTLSLLTHLKTTYGAMTAVACEANLARMSAPWSPPALVENHFDQFDEGQRYALLAAEPIADTQLMRLGLKFKPHLVIMLKLEHNHQMWYVPDGC